MDLKISGFTYAARGVLCRFREVLKLLKTLKISVTLLHSVARITTYVLQCKAVRIQRRYDVYDVSALIKERQSCARAQPVCGVVITDVVAKVFQDSKRLQKRLQCLFFLRFHYIAPSLD
jgi:hypothetical protein